MNFHFLKSFIDNVWINRIRWLLLLLLLLITQIQSKCYFSGSYGNVFGYGNNDDGQLGIGSCCLNKFFPIPVNFSLIIGSPCLNIVSVAAGGYHNMYLTSSRILYTAGNDAYGQLGINAFNTPMNKLTPIYTTGLGNRVVTSIAAGLYHSLIITNSSSVWSFGYNAYGQLGIGIYNDRPAPTAVINLPVGTVSAIAAGGYHSATIINGRVYTWGYNNYGQLGIGNKINSNTPIIVNGTGGFVGKTIIQVSAGISHTVLLTSDRLVYAFGLNLNGQLGDSTLVEKTVPTLSSRPAGQDILFIAAGGFHTLLLTNLSLVYGFGSDLYGQIGDNTISTNRTTATRVYPGTSMPAVVKISAGYYHSIALDINGKMWGWGANGYGQCGDGTSLASRPAPVLTDISLVTTLGFGFGNITEISAGANTNLIIEENMFCFGQFQSDACNYVNPAFPGGGGVCTDTDHCTCNTGYQGTQCEIPICYGLINQSACHFPNGTCYAYDDCHCNYGYSGDQCQDLLCYGQSNNSGCSYPNGICISPDNCACLNNQVAGNQCQYPICYGQFNVSACSFPNGTCIGFNNCSCEIGFTGTQCEHYICYGLIDTIACNHPNGTCISPDTCICNYGYTGDQCEFPICNYTYGTNACHYPNGTCISPETCSCADGYISTVEYCDSWKCFSIERTDNTSCSNENGTCIGPNQCACKDGYFGNECQVYGMCTQVNNCSDLGICIGFNNCSCFEGFFDLDCSKDCFDYNNCSHHGNCIDKENCTCFSGWLGKQCSIEKCDPEDTCNSNGYCSPDNECICYDFNFGVHCEHLDVRFGVAMIGGMVTLLILVLFFVVL
jgi:alpha-tubulin suppressor-like RCC1 family protein